MNYRHYITFIVLICCAIAVNSQNKPFEGTIRMLISQNVSSTTGLTDKAVSTIKGDKFTKAIAKKIVKKQAKKTDKFLQKDNGDYEVWIKVKGNKVAYFTTRNGELIIYDGDEQHVTTAYPFAKGSIRYNLAQWPAKNIKKEIKHIEGKNELILGHDCKKCILTYAQTTEEAWYTTDIVLPDFFLSIGQQPGLVLKSHLKTEGLVGIEIYSTATEIKQESIPDDVFTLPKDCPIVSIQEFGKLLKKATKKMEDKPIQIGTTIPDTFWDF